MGKRSTGRVAKASRTVSVAALIIALLPLFYCDLGAGQPPDEGAVVRNQPLDAQPPESEAEWQRLLTEWRNQMKGRESLRHEELADDIALIRAIGDPLAVKPLRELLRNERHHPWLAMLYLEPLADIGDKAAVETLVLASILAADERVRTAAAEALARAEARHEAVPMFVTHLRTPALRDRAAKALLTSGLLQPTSESEVPDKQLFFSLVNALSSPQDDKVPVIVWRLERTFGFGQAKSGGRRFHSRREFLKVEYEVPNPSVHEALTYLTSQDYEYDRDGWLAWYKRAGRDN